MDEQLDLSTISLEDLQEEYQKLKERYSQLMIINEQDTQRIHELRRNLDTATAAEIYLSQELEQLSSTQSSQDYALLHKKQNEIEELKKRQNALLTENEELHQDVIDLRAENERLNQKIKELTLAVCPAEVTYQIPKEYLDLKEKLEEENLELLAKLDETHETVMKFTMSLAEKEKNIEILKDQVMCLEENLQSKRDEVDEKSQLLESAQEQVVEMNAKIAMLTSCPGNADRKGNSLFAEVDDQRQAMKQLLADQKKSYLHMKRVYNESQHEIRRLKRENFAMHNELQACSTIFCSADKTYKEKLNERILQLIKQNEDLEKKLMFTQQELISLANDKGVVWLDSMLLFCKQETEELKKQLHSNRIQRGILEERLRNSQQDLAKWRFEALKTRCVLVDREGLLVDNKINFKTFTSEDVKLTPVEIENAEPRLGFTNQSMSRNQNEKRNSNSKRGDLEELKQLQENSLELPVIKVEENNIKPMNDAEVFNFEEIPMDENKSCEKEIEKKQFQKASEISKTPNDAFQKELPTAQECRSCDKVKENPSILEATNSIGLLTDLKVKIEPKEEEDKENVCVSFLETRTQPKQDAKSSLKEAIRNIVTEPTDDVKPRPSILVTHKNILDDETVTKNVHFAPMEEPLKCQLSSKTKFVCKSTRTKSNVIVRRILVNSKTKTESSTSPAPL